MAYTGKYQNYNGNQSCPLALTYSTTKRVQHTASALRAWRL